MNQEWNEFVEGRIEHERLAYIKTNEAEHRRTVENQMDEMLDTNLTKSERAMVEDVLVSRLVTAEGDSKRLYRQGMRDCVAVLKELGVLG